MKDERLLNTVVALLCIFGFFLVGVSWGIVLTDTISHSFRGKALISGMVMSVGYSLLIHSIITLKKRDKFPTYIKWFNNLKF